VLILDGIRLSKDQLAVVAMGVTTEGRKHILDFELGSSENVEVCRDLVCRLVSRGFEAPDGLLAVLDGSDPLKKAVRSSFPGAVIQRCLVHKERNLRGRLSKRHWGELARLFKRLREVEGEAAGGEAYGEIERFLADKNAAALESLHEAGEDLLALHRLNVPATLHVSLLSTNLIENSFRNTRRKLGRVTHFRAETDQASRWLAAALLEAEKGFRRLTGYKDLPRLAEALSRRQADRMASRAGHPGRCQEASPGTPLVGASPPRPATPSAPATPQQAST
jgi:transposase-like protein